MRSGQQTALPGYYTTEEAAKYLGLANGSYLRALANEKKIEAYKVGKTWLISKAAIEKYAQDNRK
jgi:excisionase family DNA binding protein